MDSCVLWSSCNLERLAMKRFLVIIIDSRVSFLPITNSSMGMKDASGRSLFSFYFLLRFPCQLLVSHGYQRAKSIFVIHTSNSLMNSIKFLASFFSRSLESWCVYEDLVRSSVLDRKITSWIQAKTLWKKIAVQKRRRFHGKESSPLEAIPELG